MRVIPKRRLDDQLEAWVREQDLLLFTRYTWPYVEPNAFYLNWHGEEIVNHLMRLRMVSSVV